MGWLDILTGGLTSLATGGLTGILGIIVQRGADIWNKKQDLDRQTAQWEHEREAKKIDLSIMKEEWAQRTKVAEIEAEAAVMKGDGDAFTASQRAQTIRFSEGMKQPVGWFGRAVYAIGWMILTLLDFFRGAIIPGLTVYLCALTTLVYMQSRDLLGAENLTIAEAMEITRRIIDTILYLTTTCVLWHFGTPNRQSLAKR